MVFFMKKLFFTAFLLCFTLSLSGAVDNASKKKMCWAHLVSWGFDLVNGYDQIFTAGNHFQLAPFSDRILAGKYIQQDSGIFLDAGSTIMALARQLPDVNTAIITSAPNIALEIAWKKQHPTIILLGGTLSRKTISISGMNVLDQLHNLNIDTAFMSASAFTEKAGFSVYMLLEHFAESINLHNYEPNHLI